MRGYPASNMTKLTLNLPHGYRLAVNFSKSRVKPAVGQNFIPRMADIRRFRSGNKFSRVFRHIFEHNSFKKILGSNLALAAIATSAFQVVPVNAKNDLSSIGNVTQSEAVLIKTLPGIQYPLANVKINQGYKFYHPGLDLEGITGDPVKPVMAGKVEYTQYSRFAYGNAVIVNHGNGITSLYAHLSKINVQKGQDVANDTVIGLVGSTGRSTGDHLHLEIRDNGVAINPLSVLPR